MLGDDQLCGASALTLFVVDLISVDEEDHVGVLLDGAALAEIAHDRALVGALLQLPVELRERDDGDFQLLGERLEPPADAGDLLLSRACGAAHELEIIDDDQAQGRAAWITVEAAGFGTQLHDADACGVIDEEGELGEIDDGVVDPQKLLWPQSAGLEQIPGDVGLSAQEAGPELDMRHLQAKEGDAVRSLGLLEPLEGEVQHQGGLPHRGAPSEDDQICGLEACGDRVEVGEAAGQPRDAAPRLIGGLYPINCLFDAFLGLDKSLVLGAVVQALQRCSSLAEELPCVLIVLLLDAPQGVLTELRQVSNLRGALHHPSMMLDVDGAGGGASEGEEEVNAPQLPQLSFVRQRGGHRYRVDGQVLLGQVEHRGVDALMLWGLEVSGFDERGHLV